MDADGFIVTNAIRLKADFYHKKPNACLKVVGAEAS